MVVNVILLRKNSITTMHCSEIDHGKELSGWSPQFPPLTRTPQRRVSRLSSRTFLIYGCRLPLCLARFW